MPSFAIIKANVRCPQCGFELPDHRVGIQWSYGANSLGTSAFDYVIGQPLLWRRDSAGSVPAWTYFEGGGGNFGDPAYDDLVVREDELFGGRCPQHGYLEVAVTIRRGYIDDVRVWPERSLSCNVSLIRPGGSLEPHPEWDDSPMGMIQAESLCLVPQPHFRAHG
jgi:hypothetical protein